MAIPALAIGVGTSLLGSLFGLGQKTQARRLERNNIMPMAKVNENIATNLAQAKLMAQTGIAEQQYTNARNQQQQNLANILSFSSRTGRNIPVAGLLRQSNQATQNLNIADANARRQNQMLAMQQGQTMASEQQRVWQWNKANPYLRTAQQVAELRNAGNANIFGGLGNVAQMLMSQSASQNQD